MSDLVSQTERAASVRALEFWKDTKTNPDGTVREVHWVAWAKIGDMHYHQVNVEVDRLRKTRTDDGMERQDPVWLAIQPAYEAWLKGMEAPVDGTSLDAWPALGKRQIKAFREAGYRSVEEIAEITDSDLPRVRIPDIRKLRDAARGYVENKKGSAHIEAAMVARDEEIANLKALVEDMRAALAQASQTNAAA